MLSMYQSSLPPLERALQNLSNNLSTGEKHVLERQIAPENLLNARLFVDMYPLTRQVQIATDMSKGAAARLAGIEIPKYEDNETSFAELQARIQKTIAFLDSITAEQLEGAKDRTIVLTVRNSELRFTGQDYLQKWVFPNVYFHVTTAYNIMRHCGVPLGKQDFLGPRDEAS